MLGPRQADEHHDAVLERQVEQPVRRHGEGADALAPSSRMRAKSRCTELRARELRAVLAGRERPVGDAAQEELLGAAEEELAAGGEAVGRLLAGHVRAVAVPPLSHRPFSRSSPTRCHQPTPVWISEQLMPRKRQ